MKPPLFFLLFLFINFDPYSNDYNGTVFHLSGTGYGTLSTVLKIFFSRFFRLLYLVNAYWSIALDLCSLCCNTYHLLYVRCWLFVWILFISILYEFHSDQGYLSDIGYDKDFPSWKTESV